MSGTRYALKVLKGIKNTAQLKSFKSFPASIRYAGRYNKEFRQYVENLLMTGEIHLQPIDMLTAGENYEKPMRRYNLKFNVGGQLPKLLRKNKVELLDHLKIMDSKSKQKTLEYAEWREKFLEEFERESAKLQTEPLLDDVVEKKIEESAEMTEEELVAYNEKLRAALQEEVRHVERSGSALREVVNQIISRAKVSDFDDSVDTSLPEKITINMIEEDVRRTQELFASDTVPENVKMNALTRLERILQKFYRQQNDALLGRVEDKSETDRIKDARQRVAYYRSKTLLKPLDLSKYKSLEEYLNDINRLQFMRDIDYLKANDVLRINADITQDMINEHNKRTKFYEDAYFLQYERDNKAKLHFATDVEYVKKVIELKNLEIELESKTQNENPNFEAALKIQQRIDELQKELIEINFAKVEKKYPQLNHIVQAAREYTNRISEFKKSGQLDWCKDFLEKAGPIPFDEISLENEPKYTKEEQLQMVYKARDALLGYWEKSEEAAKELEKDLDKIMDTQKYKQFIKEIEQLEDELFKPHERIPVTDYATDPNDYQILYLLKTTLYNMQPRNALSGIQKHKEKLEDDVKFMEEMCSDKMDKEGEEFVDLLEDVAPLLEKYEEIVNDGDLEKINSKPVRDLADKLMKKYNIPEPSPVPGEKVPNKRKVRLQFTTTYNFLDRSYQEKRDRKVVLTARMSRFNLSKEAMARFKIIVGNKYNEEHDELKLKCEYFKDKRTNASYLVQLFQEILREAEKVDSDPSLRVPEPIYPKPNPMQLIEQKLANVKEEDLQSAEALKMWSRLRTEGKIYISSEQTYGAASKQVIQRMGEYDDDADDFKYDF